MRRPHTSGRAYRRGWAAGRDLYRQLLAGHQLPGVPVPGLRLRSGERAHAELVLDYARYHAEDVQAVPASTMVLGPPVAMAAGYALAAFADRRARKRARRAAAPQWRDTTPTRVVLTSTRTMCHAEGRWLTFGHRTVVSISADLYWHTVELNFARVDALRLSGPGACWYSVALAWLLYPPDQFAALPALADYRPQNP